MVDTNKKRLIFAAILILGGTLLLLDNLHILDIIIPHFLMEWYIILILVGAFITFVQDKKGPGVMLMGIGGLFMLSDIANVGIFDIWPVFLIIAGIAIILKRSKQNERMDSFDPDDKDYIDEFATFSGPVKAVTTQNFKGGKLSTVFAGMEIDFSSARLSEGNNVLEIFTIFGGSTIYVPQDWDVIIKVTPIFGGYADERTLVKDTDPDRTLVITGTVLFGGGDIKTRLRPSE